MTLDSLISNNEKGELIAELKREKIDSEKFLGLVGREIENTDFSKVKNKKSWLNAVIKRLKEEHQDDLTIKKKKVTTIELSIRLKKLGYTYEDYEPCLLELVCFHILNEFPVEASELQETINKIISYIEAKKLDKTFSNLINFIIQSKLRVNVPLEQLKEQAKSFNELWKDLMIELDNHKRVTIEEALGIKSEEINDYE